MHFIAEELREVLAELGLKTVEELVGRTDLLQRSRHINPKSKAASLDIEKLLHAVDGPNTKRNSSKSSFRYWVRFKLFI